MNEIKGKLIRKGYALSGNAEITFEISEGKATALALEEKEYLINLGSAKKRSLDANAYFHLLVNRIARQLKSSDDEVKKWLNLQYGTMRVESGVKVGFKLLATIDEDSVYPYLKKVGESEVGDKKFNHWIMYKRTHELDSKEMADLIDGTISEANDLGIETMTPNELAKLKGYGK